MHRAHTDPYIQGQFNPDGKTNIRKILPVEGERLQTLPDNYTAEGIMNGKLVPISDSQRYKAIGNSFTANIIAHILKFTENNPEPVGKIRQIQLFS
jgi:site-specific DNA-cytosine methylase